MNEPVSGQRFSGAPLPTPPIPDDDGAIFGELAERLAEYTAGVAGADQVLAALARSRLFVPVVAVLEESELGADGLPREKQSSMATVLVQSADGGRALLGFSSIQSLTRWQGDARPVPLAAPLAARAAVDEGAGTLLIDVAGPAPFAVANSELLQVAAVSRSPGEPCEDPVVLAALTRLLGSEDRVSAATLHPGRKAEDRSDGPKPPAVLTLAVATEDRSWLGTLVHQIASDPVVGRLLPEGLRVKDVPASDFTDTPGALLRSRRPL